MHKVTIELDDRQMQLLRELKDHKAGIRPADETKHLTLKEAVEAVDAAAANNSCLSGFTRDNAIVIALGSGFEQTEEGILKKVFAAIDSNENDV